MIKDEELKVIDGDKGKAIDLFLKEMEKAYFTGAVLIKDKGEIILSNGYGHAKKSVPNTSSTIFHVASITKQFTAAAIMQLEEEGKIDLSSSINAYLPTRFVTDEWEDITVDQLLNHTSGIPNYAEWDDYWDVCKGLTVDKVICDVQKQGLLFPSGSNQCYSNTGYTLLGKIIEKQGGMPYRDYIDKRILHPAGMLSSGIHDKSRVPPCSSSAEGYWIKNFQLAKDTRNEFSILFSDGGLYSTVHDMAKWNDVLDGKTKILKRCSIEKMIDNEYGLMVDKAFGHKRIHHNGSMAGFRSDFCKFPDNDIFIVILGNNADFVVEYLTGNLSQFLLDDSFSLPHLVPFPPEFNYSPYLKKFQPKERDEDRKTYSFKLNHHRQLILEGDPPTQCFLLSNECLYVPTEGQELKLQKNGKINVYGEDGEKANVLEPPSSSFLSRILNFFK